MKNFIIGYGESLTTDVKIKSGSGPKAHPYSFAEARAKLVSDLQNVIEDVDAKQPNQCSNGEIVVKFIQHPSYLAKSYYPSQLFKKFGIKDLGSRSVKVKPRKWAVKKHPVEGLASCIFVSGTRSKFEAMLNTVAHEHLPDVTQKLIRSIEQVSSFSAHEKVKAIDESSKTLRLEVVLHAEATDRPVFQSFTEYAETLGGVVDWQRAKNVGGLTFLPVEISKGLESELAEFSHVRALRSVPKLRFNRPDAIRTTLKESFSLPKYEPLNNKFKVCILDGGIGSENVIKDWIHEHIPVCVQSSHPSLLAHGGEVCSTYLFGPFDPETKSFKAPYTNVDIVRVLSADDRDPDLFDVLTRIENVLKEKNISILISA